MLRLTNSYYGVSTVPISLKYSRTAEELDDQDIGDVVAAFYRLKATSWLRRQQAATMPKVLAAVQEARLNGDKPDVPAIIKQVLIDGDIPLLEIE